MERRGRLLKPAGRCCSLRGLALARSRVERHIQCQSLLAGCSFGPLELAGDLGGRRLLPRERLEFAHVLRCPLSPFRLLDHHVLPGCAIKGVYVRRSLSSGPLNAGPDGRAMAPSANAANSNRHLSPKSSSFCPPSRSFYCLKVDIEKGFVLLALLLVLLAQANHFSKDPNVEAVVLGFKIDFLSRFGKFLDLFLDMLDAFDDRA